MQRPSRSVHSTQQGVHDDLLRLLERRSATNWSRPIADHNRAAFDACTAWLGTDDQPIVLDAGCGTGASTLRLAQLHAGARVIGVDKSAARLATRQAGPAPSNLLLVRADLQDFWRLARAAGWRLQHHYLLYPNPWPKPAQLARRWHGHPVFADILALGGELELRSNWSVYVDECATALVWHGRRARLEAVPATSDLTPFERKYLRSGQPCWRLVSPSLD